MYQLAIEKKTIFLSILDFARLCHPNIPFDMKKMRCDIACHIRQGTFFTKSRTNMPMNDDTAGGNETYYDENEDDQFEAMDHHHTMTISRSNSSDKNPFDSINDDDSE